VEVLIPYSESGIVQECYDYGRVLAVQHTGEGIHVRAELVRAMADRLAKFLK
ncbi:MAG: GTPase HflX, partial [Armatimonadota bacterium]